MVVMSEPEQKRNNSKEKTRIKPNRGTKRIYIPVEQEDYQAVIEDLDAFRTMLDENIAQYPVIFPLDISQGYKLNGWVSESKKIPDVRMRRICLRARDDEGKKQVYNIAPSFVMPYMVGYTEDVEKGLFLHEKFGVPFWGLTYVFGHYDSYWERMVIGLGRYHLVGTTVQSPDKLPEDLLADEKHTKLNGEKVYIATTVGNDCVLGASLALDAGETSLTEAYGHFQEEAQEVKADYQPQTVNTDGWRSTFLAWQTLFPSVTILLCFLHSFIKIRSCSKRFREIFATLGDKVWDIYNAPDEKTFRARVSTLSLWGKQNVTGAALEAILKLGAKVDDFVKAYDFPTAYRTSNMIDRHMEPMARFLYCTRYFHGHMMSAEKSMRAWALAHNFLPYCPRAKVAQTYISPAHKLNGFVYHENWLQNLLVSASMGGCHRSNKIR
jgi:hypothetical protein